MEQYSATAKRRNLAMNSTIPKGNHSSSLCQRPDLPRPFSCPVCDKRFTLAHHLSSHALTHTGERPYSCNFCISRFSQTSSLRRHMYKLHGQSYQAHALLEDFSHVNSKMTKTVCASDDFNAAIFTGEDRTTSACNTSKTSKTHCGLQHHNPRYRCKNPIDASDKTVNGDETRRSSQEINIRGGIEQPPLLSFSSAVATEKKRNKRKLQPPRRCAPYVENGCRKELKRSESDDGESSGDDAWSQGNNTVNVRASLSRDYTENSLDHCTGIDNACDDSWESVQVTSRECNVRVSESDEIDSLVLDSCPDNVACPNDDPDVLDDGLVADGDFLADRLRHGRQGSVVDRPYGCPVCNRSFRLMHHLTSHMVTHTGERPFACYSCGRRFTQNSSLRRHVSKHCRVAGRAMVKSCDKAFVIASSISEHMAAERLMNNIR